MTGRRKALLALYGTGALLAAPWVADWLRVRLGLTSWRPPAIPRIRITTGRFHP